MASGVDARVEARLLGTATLTRTGVLVLAFALAAVVESVRLSALRNPDIWLHLRVGSWMLTNRAWPTSGLFSQAANLPWRDFNWLADGTIALAYRLVGLSAIPALAMIYRVILALLTFLLAGGSWENFWIPTTISAVAQALLYSLEPLATGCSAVLFAIVLLVLLVSRRTGGLRPLLFLPVLFVFWANLDLGVVYGVALFVLYLLALVIEQISLRTQRQWVWIPEARVPLGAATLLGLACLSAGLLSPYSYHAYPTFFAMQGNPANRYISAYTAMTFHRPQDYLLLLLVMAAFLSLGVRRSRDVFLFLVLIACTALSFRAQGENWLGTLAAVGILGDGLQETEIAPLLEDLWNWLAYPVVGSLAAVVLLYVLLIPHERSVLLSRVAGDFPVRACDSIRQQNLPAPLFNTYLWGGFLAWYLPEYPVAIDSRRGLYPEDLEMDYFKVMQVLVPYQSLAPMKQARTLLLDKTNVMADALRSLPGFQVAYEDSISVVLVHEQRE